MERVLRRFRSFEEAERAEIEEDMKMTPSERVRLLLELVAQAYPNASEQRLERVCRIVKRQQS